MTQNFLAFGVKALLNCCGNRFLQGAGLKKLLISSSINSLFTSSNKMSIVQEVSLFLLRIVIAVALQSGILVFCLCYFVFRIYEILSHALFNLTTSVG